MRPHALALCLVLTLGLAGCPEADHHLVEVNLDAASVALTPGESRSLQATVRCTYQPCEAALTLVSPTLPAGVQVDGLDDPPQSIDDGRAWAWSLTVSSRPDAPVFDGSIVFSVRPTDGLSFESRLVEVLDFRLNLLVTGLPGAGPVARFAFSPASPTVGQTITFDATASAGAIVTYRWDFGADGSVEATGPTATYSFGVAGPWPVQLQLVALDGTVAEATQTVVVAGTTGGSGDATLTLSFTGTGSGVVTFDPPVTACSRDGEPVCSRLFANNSTVVLTAFAYSGATLGGWGPGCSGISATGAQCTIFMDGNRQISLRID